jgi:hypothetical protein
MIGVFDQILIERQQLDPDVQCLYIYDSCSSMFVEEVYVNISTQMCISYDTFVSNSQVL